MFQFKVIFYVVALCNVISSYSTQTILSAKFSALNYLDEVSSVT